MPEHVRCYEIRGPLFFGAAEKALDVLRRFDPDVRVVVVDMAAVPMLDMTALAAFENILKDYRKQNIGLILVATTPRVRLKLRRAGVHRERRQLAYVQTLEQARVKSEQWLQANHA
jgi:SulP family sulfate permease